MIAGILAGVLTVSFLALVGFIRNRADKILSYLLLVAGLCFTVISHVKESPNCVISADVHESLHMMIKDDCSVKLNRINETTGKMIMEEPVLLLSYVPYIYLFMAVLLAAFGAIPDNFFQQLVGEQKKVLENLNLSNSTTQNDPHMHHDLYVKHLEACQRNADKFPVFPLTYFKLMEKAVRLWLYFIIFSSFAFIHENPLFDGQANWEIIHGLESFLNKTSPTLPKFNLIGVANFVGLDMESFLNKTSPTLPKFNLIGVANFVGLDMDPGFKESIYSSPAFGCNFSRVLLDGRRFNKDIYCSYAAINGSFVIASILKFLTLLFILYAVYDLFRAVYRIIIGIPIQICSIWKLLKEEVDENIGILNILNVYVWLGIDNIVFLSQLKEITAPDDMILIIKLFIGQFLLEEDKSENSKEPASQQSANEDSDVKLPKILKLKLRDEVISISTNMVFWCIVSPPIWIFFSITCFYSMFGWTCLFVKRSFLSINLAYKSVIISIMALAQLFISVLFGTLIFDATDGLYVGLIMQTVNLVTLASIPIAHCKKEIYVYCSFARAVNGICTCIFTSLYTLFNYSDYVKFGVAVVLAILAIIDTAFSINAMYTIANTDLGSVRYKSQEILSV